MSIKQTIAAVGHNEYGFTDAVYVATFELISDKVNLDEAIEKTAQDYYQTEEGQAYIKHEHGHCNFADLMTTVPREIFWRNGIALINLITIPPDGLIMDLYEDIGFPGSYID